MSPNSKDIPEISDGVDGVDEVDDVDAISFSIGGCSSASI